MSKQKTRKSALKRFKVTKTGKLMFRSHGARHLRSNKSKKHVRHLLAPKELTGTFKKKVKKMLGV
ncbi:MAG TPA: bL35 family ribosomal protein [Patescibacteria group bacterium]|nr:bL35 family ribosomal protein [Patescibacteria group bacterium]